MPLATMNTVRGGPCRPDKRASRPRGRLGRGGGAPARPPSPRRHADPCGVTRPGSYAPGQGPGVGVDRFSSVSVLKTLKPRRR